MNILHLFLPVVSLLPAGAWAQDETAWQRHFVGRFVMARFDLPASSDGFQIEYRTEGKATRLRHQERETAIIRYGIGVAAGEVARITKLRVKKKHIEVHLNGGGRNAWGASLADSSFQGPTRAPGGSRINLRFDRRLQDLAEDPVSRIQILLRQALIFEQAAMKAQKQALIEKAQKNRQRILLSMARQRGRAGSAKPAAGNSSSGAAASTQARPGPTDPVAVIAPNLKNRVEALSVAKFCLGHTERDFSRIVEVMNDYAALRQEWQKSLPASMAEKRYQEMMASQLKIFSSREGLFHVAGSGSLKAYLRPEARILVADLKPDRSGKFLNAFVEISYPRPDASPLVTVRRRLKKTYLMIPVQGSWVLVTPPLPSSRLFGHTIRRLREAEEYW